MSRPGLWRTLAALAALLVALAAVDGWLRHRRVAQRALTGLLRPLVDPALEVVPERVRRVRVQTANASRSWAYEWDGRAWRLPALHGAYAATDQVDFLLKGLLLSLGTAVTTNPGAQARYGLLPGQAPRVVLLGGGGNALLEVLLGRTAPDNRGAEAYVRRAGSDTVFHLHANPARALAGNPPMLDPHVLPRALTRRALVEVAFHDPGANPATAPTALLRRVDVPPDPAAPGPPSMGASHAWVLTHAGGRDTCETASVGAYLGYLSQLQYQTVLPPQGDYALDAGRGLTLVDDDGTVDRLDVGDRTDGDLGYVRHPNAGVTFAVAAGALDLLFPSPELLLQPLPQPSPYDAPHPPGRAP